MGTRQTIGCIKEEPTTLQRDIKEVEENTIKRRIQTAANPIEKRLAQKSQELKRKVSKEPNSKNPNHSKMQNMESAVQRRVL